MITLEIVLGVHRVLIKKYGGAAGVRDMGALESAVLRRVPPALPATGGTNQE